MYINTEAYDLYDFPVNACLRVPPFDDRILAQRAMFIAFADPALPMEPVELDDDGKQMSCGNYNLVKFLIPAEAKALLHRTLQDVGMTPRTLFPDLEGLSRDFVDDATCWHWIKNSPKPRSA
jgi:hypothetical protein